MYIVINAEDCPDFKNQISNMIDEGDLLNWEFEVEEGKRRLKYKGEDHQYGDVMLRFLKSNDKGGTFIKIRPTVKNGVDDTDKAMSHFGIVLGRFAELINSHFPKIGTYTTIID